MNLQSFEARVLQMWMTTRIPLTRPNMQFYTKAPRKKMERWLDEMVGEGVLEVDSDDDGEMVWAVRGAVRAKNGPETVADHDKLDHLRGEVSQTHNALVLAARATGLSTRGTNSQVADRKSIIASGALSFFFGPVGWLYAAPLREAIPAILVFATLWWLIPIHFIFYPLFLLSGLAGAGYAWRYNQTGERTPIAGDVKRVLPSKRAGH